MFVAINKSRGTCDLTNLQPSEYAALLQAITHEMVRSKARQEDVRLSEETRAREELNLASLTGMQRRLRTHEGELRSESSPTVH